MIKFGHVKFNPMDYSELWKFCQDFRKSPDYYGSPWIVFLFFHDDLCNGVSFSVHDDIVSFSLSNDIEEGIKQLKSFVWHTQKRGAEEDLSEINPWKFADEYIVEAVGWLHKLEFDKQLAETILSENHWFDHRIPQKPYSEEIKCRSGKVFKKRYKPYEFYADRYSPEIPECLNRGGSPRIVRDDKGAYVWKFKEVENEH